MTTTSSTHSQVVISESQFLHLQNGDTYNTHPTHLVCEVLRTVLGTEQAVCTFLHTTKSPGKQKEKEQPSQRPDDF